jgi:hypothetical protein
MMVMTRRNIPVETRRHFNIVPVLRCSISRESRCLEHFGGSEFNSANQPLSGRWYGAFERDGCVAVDQQA